MFLDVSPEQFRTAWFLESVVSAALIVFIVRSRHAFFKTRPSTYLTLATLSVVVITVSVPYTPLAPLIGFVPLPPYLLALLSLIVILYLSTAEIAKLLFYRHTKI